MRGEFLFMSDWRLVYPVDSRKLIQVSVGIPTFESNALAFDIAKVRQRTLEGLVYGIVSSCRRQVSDLPHLLRLLRVDGER